MVASRGVVAGALAVVAGSVDALGVIETGRTSAHMTGTFTHVTVRLTHGDWFAALLAVLAIVAFLAGSICAGIVLASPIARRRPRIVAGLVTGEALLIAAGGLGRRTLAGGAWPGMLVIACLASAEGVQNATTTVLLAPFRRTTHITSNLTDLGTEIGLRARRWLGMRTGDAVGSGWCR